MADSLSSPEYERLADIELQAAFVSSNDTKRIGHLDQAARYALFAEQAGPGPARSSEVDGLIGALSSALAVADRLRLGSASIHIDAAIIALGGSEITPPAR